MANNKFYIDLNTITINFETHHWEVNDENWKIRVNYNNKNMLKTLKYETSGRYQLMIDKLTNAKWVGEIIYDL